MDQIPENPKSPAALIVSQTVKEKGQALKLIYFAWHKPTLFFTINDPITPTICM